MRRRHLCQLLVFGGAGAAALVAGCASPTLPMPPPEQPQVTLPDNEGFITLTGAPGNAEAGARVFAYNFRTQGGVFVDADDQGAWQLRLQALAGDSLAVWQEQGKERSDYIVVPVPKPDLERSRG